MSGKHLDENSIVNELKSSSLFFHQGTASTVSHTAPKDAPTAPVERPATPQDVQVASSFPSSQVAAAQDPLQSPIRPSDGDSKGTDSITPPPQSPVPAAISPSRETTAGPILPQSTMVGSEERPNERRKVRHSFDILSDQLFALRELAVERERLFGRKVLLGDLVQEALDMFITKERNQE
jgi:hypothetical protein